MTKAEAVRKVARASWRRWDGALPASIVAALLALVAAGGPTATLADAGAAWSGSSAPHEGAASEKPANRAPVVRRPIDLGPLTVGDEPLGVEISSHFRDPDGDPLEYSVVQATIVLAVVTGSTLTLTAAAPGTDLSP
ncbi:MAG: hypothetical protein OXU63_06670 [Acidobacteriota bacterium]|nr:hypothetical protein [Acidobacteriota bacterium]